ncbi:hypothetical protein [Larkinella harenae]
MNYPVPYQTHKRRTRWLGLVNHDQATPVLPPPGIARRQPSACSGQLHTLY